MWRNHGLGERKDVQMDQVTWRIWLQCPWSYAFVWGKGKTMDFSETSVVFDIKVGKCSQLNVYMNLYQYHIKGQGHSLTFIKDHSVSNCFSFEITRPVEAKVHVEPPWDGKRISKRNENFKVLSGVRVAVEGNLIKIRSKLFTAFFGYGDIPLRVISDWPFDEPMESLLPKFGPVANGAKSKRMWRCVNIQRRQRHFPALPSQNDQKLQEFRRDTSLKVLGIAGKENLNACHAM